MRTFIAIEIPQEIKTALILMQRDLQRAAADVTWTKPENFHLTLRFLGEVEEKGLLELKQICDQVSATTKPFRMALHGAGAFPNFRQPRVLWAGLTGEIEAAREFQARLEKALVSIGFAPEDKPFKLHLTVGRVKSAKNARQVAALTEIHVLPELSFKVQEIAVMKSDLHSTGARYTTLAKSKLQLEFL